MSLYNMLHGVNPLSAVYLAMLGFTPDDVPRFRDVHLLEREDGTLAIAVYTRMGGGNRGHWSFTHDEEEPGENCSCPGCRAQHVLARHSQYLYDEDDDFDCTYATYVFRVPDAFKDTVAELASLGGQKDVPAEAWQRTFRKLGELQPGDPGDEETRHWIERGRPIIERIVAALEVPAGDKPKVIEV